MYVVKFEISSIRDSEVASGVFAIERLRNGTWIKEKEVPFITSDASGKRNFALEDDQRLVLGARTNVVTVSDPAQRAHVTVRPQAPAQSKKYARPYEDEGTNEGDIPLAELSALEFERMKHQEALERAQKEARDRAVEAAKIEAQKEAEIKAVPPIPKQPTIRVGGGNG